MTTRKHTKNSSASRRAYWESLSHSFNKHFIDEARKKYGSKERSLI